MTQTSTTIAIVKHAQGCYSIDQVLVHESFGPTYLSQEACWYRSAVARQAVRAAKADAERIARENGWALLPGTYDLADLKANHQAWKAAVA